MFRYAFTAESDGENFWKWSNIWRSYGQLSTGSFVLRNTVYYAINQFYESCVLAQLPWRFSVVASTDINEMKKALSETQTLRAGCSKAEPKNFAPPQTPFPLAQGGQNLTSWRWSLPLPTNPVWWGSMHAISSYRGNRPTRTPPTNTPINTQNKPTDRTDYNTLRRS